MDNYNRNRRLSRRDNTSQNERLLEDISRVFGALANNSRHNPNPQTHASRAFSMMAEGSRNNSDIMSNAYAIGGIILLGALVIKEISAYAENTNESHHDE